MRCPAVLLAVSVAACSDGGSDAPDGAVCPPANLSGCDPSDDSTCLALPQDDVQAALGTELPDPDVENPVLTTDGADYTCNTSAPPTPRPTGDVTVTGLVLDFQSDDALAGASIEVFAAAQFDAAPLATTTSSADGSYQIVVPTETLRDGRVFWRNTAPGQAPTHELYDPLLPDASLAFASDRVSVSEDTAETIPTVLGTTRPDGTVVVVGRVRDCQRRYVAGATARLYDDRCGGFQAIGGFEEFYFEEEYPSQRGRWRATSPDGLFVMFKVDPADSAEVRILGRLAGVETVLSRAVIPLIPDSVVITDFDPLEAPVQ